MASQNQSPFAALSFSEQQEQWRQFRAQHLEYQEVAPPPQAAAPLPRPAARAVYQENAPRHHNLDRVRAQLNNAARRAGSFQSTTSGE